MNSVALLNVSCMKIMCCQLRVVRNLQTRWCKKSQASFSKNVPECFRQNWMDYYANILWSRSHWPCFKL